MKPIDYFEDHVKMGHCPWAGTELTQTSLEQSHVCRRNPEADARGDDGCSVEDWKKCLLISHQMLPPFRAAVKEGERIAPDL